jgi:hypothetical protein
MERKLRRMAEDPIKLFANRAERLPQSDDSQTLREAIEKGIEQIPVAGPITTFVASRFWAPAGSRRLEEWLRDFADDFDRHCEGCKVENLIKDEVFISASIQVARIVVGTHQADKRLYLRNALLNIAMGKTADEVKQQIFLNAIEAFAPAHVQALNVIRGVKVPWDQNPGANSGRNYGAAIQIMVPELKGQDGLIRAVLVELRNRGFSDLSGPDTPFPAGAPHTISNLGIEFLDFVLLPEASK